MESDDMSVVHNVLLLLDITTVTWNLLSSLCSFCSPVFVMLYILPHETCHRGFSFSHPHVYLEAMNIHVYMYWYMLIGVHVYTQCTCYCNDKFTIQYLVNGHTLRQLHRYALYALGQRKKTSLLVVVCVTGY